MSFYPVFLNLQGRRVLVVGGGTIAEHKVQQLLGSGAEIFLVSPSLTPALASWAEANRFSYQPREFAPDDLAGVWLAIAATEDRAVQAQVWQASEERRTFCNVVDEMPMCSFIAPAITAQGDIQIAISTSGKSPALAQRLKQEIATLLRPEHAHLARLLGHLRPYVKRHFPKQEQRAEVFQRLVRSDLLALIQQGRREQVKRRARSLLRDALQKTGVS